MRGQAEVFAQFLASLPPRDRDRLAPVIARMAWLDRGKLELILLGRALAPDEVARVLLRRAGFDGEA